MAPETNPIPTGKEMAAEIAANEMERLQGEAHALHAAGDDAGAAARQEASALAGSQPAYDAQGNRISQTGNDYLVTHPASNNTAFFTAKPKDVMDIVHGRALEENVAREQAAEVAGKQSKNTPKKLGSLTARLFQK